MWIQSFISETIFQLLIAYTSFNQKATNLSLSQPYIFPNSDYWDVNFSDKFFFVQSTDSKSR